MKIRKDFVSNSSSSSFIVDKEKHGSWFSQLINIIRNINTECIEAIYIWFDNKVDSLSLFYNIKQSIEKYKCNDYFSLGFSRTMDDPETVRDEVVLSFHELNLINIVRNKEDFMNYIIRIRVDLGYDVQDGYIYKQLEDTGLKFEWHR